MNNPQTAIRKAGRANAGSLLTAEIPLLVLVVVICSQFSAFAQPAQQPAKDEWPLAQRLKLYTQAQKAAKHSPRSGQTAPHAEAANFTDLAADKDGNLYVLDAGRRAICKYDPTGKLLTNIIENWPSRLLSAIALDKASGVIYFTDSAKTSPYKTESGIFKATPKGDSYEVELLDSSVSEFYYWTGLSVDSKGSVYTACTAPGFSHLSWIFKYDASGKQTAILGPCNDSIGVAVDDNDVAYYLYQSDSTNAKGFNLVKLVRDSGGTYQLVEVLKGLSLPKGITTDSDGNIYIVDYTGLVRKYNSDGKRLPSAANCGWQAAKPQGIAVADTKLYIANGEKVFVADAKPMPVLSSPLAFRNIAIDTTGLWPPGKENIYLAGDGVFVYERNVGSDFKQLKSYKQMGGVYGITTDRSSGELWFNTLGKPDGHYYTDNFTINACAAPYFEIEQIRWFHSGTTKLVAIDKMKIPFVATEFPPFATQKETYWVISKNGDSVKNTREDIIDLTYDLRAVKGLAVDNNRNAYVSVGKSEVRNAGVLKAIRNWLGGYDIDREFIKDCEDCGALALDHNGFIMLADGPAVYKHGPDGVRRFEIGYTGEKVSDLALDASGADAYVLVSPAGGPSSIWKFRCDPDVFIQ